MVAIPQEGLARKEWVTSKKPDWSLHRGFCWCLERFRPDLEPSQQEVSTSGFFPPQSLLFPGFVASDESPLVILACIS